MEAPPPIDISSLPTKRISSAAIDFDGTLIVLMIALIPRAAFVSGEGGRTDARMSP